MNLINKIKDYKNSKIITGEMDEFKRFFIVVGTMTVIVFSVFLFTKHVINDGDIYLPLYNDVPGTINYNIVSVGNMLSKADKEYYVHVFSGESNKASQYQIPTYAYRTSDEKNKLPIYFLNLDNVFNKSFVATKEKPENVNAKTVEEISFGEITMLKIKDGKIIKYFNTEKAIEEELKVEKN